VRTDNKTYLKQKKVDGLFVLILMKVSTKRWWGLFDITMKNEVIFEPHLPRNVVNKNHLLGK